MLSVKQSIGCFIYLRCYGIPAKAMSVMFRVLSKRVWCRRSFSLALLC